MVGGPIWMLKKFFGLIWFISLLVQIGLIFVYFRFYKYGEESNPAEVPVPYEVAEAVDAAVNQVPAALPESDVELRPTLVLPLQQDRENELVTRALRNALSEDGRYRSKDLGRIDQVLKMLKLSDSEVTDPAKAIELAKNAEADVVILGRVENLKTGDDASVTFHIDMYEAESGAKVFSQTFTSQKKPEPAEVPSAVPQTSNSKNGWLYAGLVCFSLFWPLLLMPAMRRVIQAENNALTAVMLTATVTVPLAVAWTLIFGGDWGVWSVLAFLAAGALVAVWTVFVMSRVAEAEAY